jgi:hypothetical protein
MKKQILLATFILPERLTWFLNYLETKFNIKKEKVFCYKNLDDESKIILTFKIDIPDDKSLNLKKIFPSGITIHKKGNALYTINALNKIIELDNTELLGNINYKEIKIDWELYQNKLILIKGKDLYFFNISRVF